MARPRACTVDGLGAVAVGVDGTTCLRRCQPRPDRLVHLGRVGRLSRLRPVRRGVGDRHLSRRSSHRPARHDRAVRHPAPLRSARRQRRRPPTPQAGRLAGPRDLCRHVLGALDRRPLGPAEGLPDAARCAVRDVDHGRVRRLPPNARVQRPRRRLALAACRHDASSLRRHPRRRRRARTHGGERRRRVRRPRADEGDDRCGDGAHRDRAARRRLAPGCLLAAACVAGCGMAGRRCRRERRGAPPVDRRPHGVPPRIEVGRRRRHTHDRVMVLGLGARAPDAR